MRKRRNDVTAERLRELLTYDALTGVFVWLQGNGPERRGALVKAGDIAGHVTPKGYVAIRVDGVSYQAHRLAWLYCRNAWPVFDVDHRDTVGSHNWIDNLRDVPNALNRQNVRKARSDSATGIQGVSPYRKSNRFQARIRLNNRHHYLGTFATVEAARAAYVEAKHRLHTNWLPPSDVGQGVQSTIAPAGCKRVRCNSRIGLQGVQARGNKFIARRKGKHLGTFDTALEAHQAFLRA